MVRSALDPPGLGAAWQGMAGQWGGPRCCSLPVEMGQQRRGRAVLPQGTQRGGNSLPPSWHSSFFPPHSPEKVPMGSISSQGGGHAPHTPHSAPDSGCHTWGPFELSLPVTGDRTGHLRLLEDETPTPTRPRSSHPAPCGDVGRSQLNHPDLGFLIKPKKLVQPASLSLCAQIRPIPRLEPGEAQGKAWGGPGDPALAAPRVQPGPSPLRAQRSRGLFF